MKDIINNYTQEINHINTLVEELNKTERRLSFMRLITAIIGVAIAILAFKSSITYGILSIILIGIIFFIIFIRHEKTRSSIAHLTAKKSIQENEINALTIHKNMYSNGEMYLDPSHDYSDDLDIFGNSSLFGLINRCASIWGGNALASKLSVLPTIEEIQSRQESIVELANDKEWRDEFITRLWLTESKSDANLLSKIKSLTSQDYSVVDLPIIKIALWFVPLFWIAILVLYFFSVPFLSTITLAGAIAIFTLYLRYASRVNEIHNSISTGKNYLSEYIDIFNSIYDRKWESRHLSQLIQKEKGESQIVSLNKLDALINKLDYRLNMIVGFILNLATLWDFQIVKRLKEWSEQYEEDIPALFSSLGEVEALTSLSIWAYNHPDHVLPIVAEEIDYKLKEVRHPLMKEGQCVPNDFNLTIQDHINIITGSNMSGKSTILRTIGVNMVLAYSGTTVDASEFKIPRVRIITYMRIKDALEESVSTFKAELNRVKVILDSLNKGDRALYLIDEMLRGTNSKDKLKGSIAITKKILDHHAYAIIATHDIQLAELSLQQPKHIRNYYFDIEFEGEDLVFDYKLKEGICSNFNASHLLKQIGVE